MALLGNQCRQCGFSDVRALQVDHIVARGHTKEKRNQAYFHYWQRVLKSLQAGEERFQLLCANCNWIKRYTEGATGGHVQSA